MDDCDAVLATAAGGRWGLLSGAEKIAMTRVTGPPGELATGMQSSSTGSSVPEAVHATTCWADRRPSDAAVRAWRHGLDSVWDGFMR